MQSRIIGVDVVRAIAIMGMIVAHMASLLWTTKVIISGIPAALFAIIAGTTLMLVRANNNIDSLLRILVRGSIIVLAGIVLLPVGGEIQIVLVAMGLSMILLCWVPPFHYKWKIALFLASMLIATVLYSSRPLPNTYPIMAWVSYFLAGMILYEVYINPHRNTRRLRLLITAVCLPISMVGLYLRFETSVPNWLQFTGHSGALGEILLSVALCAVIMHICLVVGDYVPKLLYPFAALGSMSLTFYIVHILTAYYWQKNVVLYSTATAVGFIALFILAASLWKKKFHQGPAERLVSMSVNKIVPKEKEN